MPKNGRDRWGPDDHPLFSSVLAASCSEAEGVSMCISVESLLGLVPANTPDEPIKVILRHPSSANGPSCDSLSGYPGPLTPTTRSVFALVTANWNCFHSSSKSTGPTICALQEQTISSIARK